MASTSDLRVPRGAEYVYDAADRTTSIRPLAARGAPLEFVYRGAGQSERVAAGPIAKHLTTGGPVCAPVVGCTDDPNQVAATSTYTHSTLGLSTEEIAGVTVSYVRDPAGNLLAQHAGGTTQYLLADGLGSIVRVNDHTAGTVATYDYDPFGNLTETSGVTEITPFRYAGYYFDATGLYKAGERYYDPAHGRWTQQDPVYDYFDPKLWNRYVYVGNDPINYVDPSGLFSVCNNRVVGRVIDWLSPIPGWDGLELKVATAPSAFGLLWLRKAFPGSKVAKIVGKAAKGGLVVSAIAGVADLIHRSICDDYSRIMVGSYSDIDSYWIPSHVWRL